ncbi:NTP transferase domain-containing protein [Priestia abyssalis]|uniref:NTP transferase domain-containing protein n=1 Tax=Priestia abyssalis TaxID=1221450 RepID=UPI0009954163|nr:NTP transferase domain-containing protein [Priestia abyssalis]
MNRKRIIAVYLAAGKSSRMGTNKLSLSLGETTVGSSGLQAALQSMLHHVIVVAKAEDTLDWMDPIFFSGEIRKRWTCIPCPEAQKGQAYSLRCGLQEGKRMKADGIMILLADQPFISAQMINDLIDGYETHKNIPFITANFRSILRPPVLFSPEVFPSLMRLEGDEGARKLLRQGAVMKGMAIEYMNERAFYDIDTKEDYERVKGGRGNDYGRRITSAGVDAF